MKHAFRKSVQTTEKNCKKTKLNSVIVFRWASWILNLNAEYLQDLDHLEEMGSDLNPFAFV